MNQETDLDFPVCSGFSGRGKSQGHWVQQCTIPRGKKAETTEHILATAIHSLVGHKVWITSLRSKRFQLHLMYPDLKILHKKYKSPKHHKTIWDVILSTSVQQLFDQGLQPLEASFAHLHTLGAAIAPLKQDRAYSPHTRHLSGNSVFCI